MSCFIEVKINGKPVVSQLQPKILEILKNNPHIVLQQYEDLDYVDELTDEQFEEVAGKSFNYFTNSDFAKDFGNWQDGEVSNNIYDNGEPKLEQDKNNKKYFYRNKYNDKVYFPLEQNGLNYIYSSEEIQDGTQLLAYKLFTRNFNNDWNDLSFMNDKATKEVIKEYMEARIDTLRNIGSDYEADAVEDSLIYIDEWVDNVNEYFEKLGFKIEETDSEIQDETADNSRGWSKTSHEMSPSSSVGRNIWAFLSFLPTSKSADLVFNEYGFEDVNDIYSTLISELKDLSPTIIGGQVEDVFQTMLDKIGELAHKKPYFKELLNILNNPSLSENRKSEFTQAFNLVKNPYFVSEVDFSGKNNIKHTVKDVSQVNANFNSIKREWGFNFETMFMDKGVLDTVKLTEIRDRTKMIRSEVDQLRKTIKTPTDLVPAINKILTVLHDFGAVTTEEGFKSYIGQLEDVIIPNEELLNNVNDVLSIVEKFGDNLLTKDPKNKIKVFDYGKFINPFNTQSLFSDLAKEEAFYKADGSDASIYSAKKSYWVYSLPSYLGGEINKWKSNIDELENLYREPGNESSKVLQYLLGYEVNRLDKVRIPIAEARIKAINFGIFNVFQEKKTDDNSSDPKNNGELSKTDANVDSMNRVLAYVKGQQSLFNTPTPADKLTSYLISHGYFLNTNVNQIIDKKAVLPSKVIQVFYDYFSSEYTRMIKSFETINDPNAKKYVHYHHNKKGFKYAQKDKDGKLYNFNNDGVGQLIGNAFKSQIFEGLSFENIKDVLPEIADKIYQDDGRPALKTIDSYETQIKDYIHNILKEGIADKVSFLTNEGIITPNKETKGGYDSNGIDGAIMKAYEAYDYPVMNAVSDYYINGLISNVEYSKMFSGDPAYYKNMVDYAKRIPSTYTDGLQLRLLNNDELTFNAAIVTGVEVAGRNLADIKEIAGEKIANMYSKGKVNTTDAQAYITPARWEFLVKRLGLWHDKIHGPAFEKMMGRNNEPFEEKEIKAVAQPLKGVYFKRNNGVPTFLKYSQAVLLPGLIKGTDLQRLYDKMVADPKNIIDEVITFDGIKVGATTTDTIHNEDGTLLDDFNLTPLEMDNRGWKLQQNLPTKGIKDTDTGSQIQKNVLAGIAHNMEKLFTKNGSDITGKDLYKDINNIVGALSQKGVDELSRELGIDEAGKINNKEGLYKLLLDEAKKRNINENLIKSLEKELTIYGIPQAQSKLMNMFMSIVKDRIVKIKTNGGSFIQVSNFGIDKLNYKDTPGVKWFIDPENGLKPPHIVDVEIDFKNKETGEIEKRTVKKIKPGQVLLPGSLLTKYIPNWKDIPADKLKEMISPEILENIIGYRIPNQGLSSNDALEIVGFLPEGMGDAVVAYSEIPTKTGSDFDIDKMFMMIPSFKPVYAKTKKVRNYVKKLKGRTINDTIELINDELDRLSIPEKDIDVAQMAKLMFDETNKENLFYAQDLLVDGIINTNNNITKDLRDELDLNVAEKLIYAKPKTTVNTFENTEVKEGVADLFVENKELKNIGTEKQYSAYLETIFPDSKIKDIVYHATTAKFDEFDNSFINMDGANSFGAKFYFLPIAMKHMIFSKERKITAVLNAPTFTDFYEQGTYETSDNIRRFEEGQLEEIAVNSSEQIYILGNDADITKFKEFIKNNKTELPLSEQPKEVLQNKLIESYKAVFLHPDVVKDVMTPIDFDYIKRDINTIFEQSGKQKDLHHFDVTSQINIKYDFLAGKAGVGQTANMLVDHVRGMFTKNSLRDTYIGWGHKNNVNETLFDKEYSVELNAEDSKYISETVGIPIEEASKYKISNSISAILNAFVDIAKDPYITRGNWTTQTSNVGLMMLRAGMHPMYVNRFIGQPIIKEYIDFVVNAESKFNNEQGNIRKLFLEYYEGKFEAELKNTQGTYSDFVDEASLKQLDNEIKNPTPDKQSRLIARFFELQDHSKKVVQGINAAKPDTQSSGKDLSSRLIAQNIIEEIENADYRKEVGALTNFSDKLVDPTTGEETILGHYVNNSVYWLDSVVKANPNLFQMANENVENTFNVISQQIRGTKLLNQDIADSLYSSYYAYSLSGFEALQLKSPAVELFVELPKQLAEYKLEDDTNYLLNQLEIISDGGMSYIKLQNKKRSEGIQNKLYRGWKDLFEDNRDLATKLVKYAYYQSGFKNNINEFFSHIPHEYLVENRLNYYIYDLDASTNNIQTKFIDQMFRHQANNTLLVPNLPKKLVSELEPGISYRFENKEYVELKPFAKVGDNLVKLEGYNTDGSGIYVKTFKLGIDKNFIEYSYDKDVKMSQIPSNTPANMEAINSYLKTLKVSKKPGELNTKTKKVNTVPALTEAEKEFNDINKSEASTQYQELVDEYSENKLETTKLPEDLINHSGGAKGGDMLWDSEGRKRGVESHNHYTVDYYNKLDDRLKMRLDGQYKEAVKFLGRGIISGESYAGKLVRRDMVQANEADGIYGITELVAPGIQGRKGYKNKMNYIIPEGGTGYAIARGILLNKPTYVFNQSNDYGVEIGWYKWNQNNFTKVNTPTLTTNFAGIGSRNINELGKSAIKNVYDETFNPTSKPSIQQQEVVNKVSENKPTIKKKFSKPVEVAPNQLDLFSQDINDKLDEFDNGCKNNK